MRSVLLDTHVFVWALAEPERVPKDAWTILEDRECVLHFSIASAWELTINAGLGKIRLPGGVRAFVATGCQSGGVSLLPIDLSHLHALESLPDHHRDPFDRMILAQSLAESMLVLSYDGAFDAYDVARA